MDISEEYIEMCRKSQEIQDLRSKFQSYQEGDFYSDTLNIKVASYYPSCQEYAEDGHDDFIKSRRSCEVWLPRQDQLQEILNLPLNDLLDVFIGFIPPTSNIVIVNEISKEKKEEFKEAWVKSMKQCTPAMVLDENINLPTITRIFSFLTLEQFWLGIVMQKKYNKIWNFETKTWEVK